MRKQAINIRHAKNFKILAPKSLVLVKSKYNRSKFAVLLNSKDNFVANVVRNSPRGNQPLIVALHVSRNRRVGSLPCELYFCILYLMNDAIFFRFSFTVSKCALDLVDDEK